nr:penicillin-binding protein 2 [bacterium]
MPKYRTVEVSEEKRTVKRVFFIGAFLAVSFGVLFCRAVSFRLSHDERLEEVALRQYRTAVRMSTKRGRILDSKGRELAIDVPVESVYANPRGISDPVNAANEISKVLKINRSKLLERLTSNRKFVWVQRRVTEEQAKKIMNLNLDEIYVMKENSRFYPGQNLASTILGAVGMDSEPLGGIELHRNNELSSSSSPGVYRRDAKGNLYLSPSGLEDPKVSDVELTIDKTLQYIAGRELEKGVREARASGGTAIVVDVDTGAILAISNQPNFDPNNYSKYPLSNWKNSAVLDSYEPGSTFKVVIVASALDAGVVRPSDVFDCENGSLRIGNKVIKDAHPHGKLSVADIIRVSSNIGAYKVEQKLSWDGIYSYIRKFGFGQVTGIDFPGEASGILSSPRSWSALQHATIAFGQGIAATPIQMTMAFAAIANGGTLYKPFLVKKVVQEDGVVFYESLPQVKGNPISPETSNIMRELLIRVVEKGGTGTLASSSEYKFAGKTGTAQKADKKTGGYAKGKYYSSFVGFAPADDPKIAVFVGIDEPRGVSYYGGQVAAPVFREIAESTLHYLKVKGSPAIVADSILKQLPPADGQGDIAQLRSADDVKFQEVESDDSDGDS